jgi:hypothetical protein
MDTVPRDAAVLDLPRDGRPRLCLIAFFALAFCCSCRNNFQDKRWFLKLAVWTLPAPWMAIECGWFVAEYGRQPWAVDGVLPTFYAASGLALHEIVLTLAGFTAIYTAAGREIKLMLKAIRKGPDEVLPSLQSPQPHASHNARRRPPARLRQENQDGFHSSDYTTLRVIWWLLLGVLLIGFAVTDGFDLGVGTLLPFVARNDAERRLVINTIGPVWEGNQVWLILGGGAIFAAWPPLYAVSFSGLLPGDVPGPVRADPASGRLQVPQQDAQRALAQHLGLGAVHRRLHPGADHRRGGGQRAAGRAVPLR